MFVDQPETPVRVGIRIERPPSEKIGSVYFLLMLASLILIGFTAWLLALEWTGTPLPASLKLAVGS